MLSNQSEKVLSHLAFPLAKDVFPKLATKATSSILDKFERNTNVQRTVRAGRRFILFISNKDINDIKIAESLEKSGLLIDGVSETVKNEIKNEKVDFLELLWQLWLIHR